MSALNLVQIRHCLRTISVNQQDYDDGSLNCINEYRLHLDILPADILLILFTYLDKQSLGRVAQVCVRFKDLSYSDCLWMVESRWALASNQLEPVSIQRSQKLLGAREKVRVGVAWSQGACLETLVTKQNIRYMPWVQLESERLWVSWGRGIWCYRRLQGGSVARATTRIFYGHADDVSKFIVKNGMVLSGGRDRSIRGWNAKSGEFLFTRRNCHQGEVTAVDVAGGGYMLVTGSRDKTVVIWAMQEDYTRRNRLLPVPVQSLFPEDRVWCLATSHDSTLLSVGTAATQKTPPVRLYDVGSGQHFMDLGVELKNGAGMLDMAWLSNNTLLSCGYDTFTRLWDTRCRSFVRCWEEEFDESVYCLATDGVNVLVTGTAHHGRVRVWDMRGTAHLYMRNASPTRRGQSSPVYSIAIDATNMYVALDQSLNHFGFGGTKPKTLYKRRHKRI